MGFSFASHPQKVKLVIHNKMLIYNKLRASDRERVRVREREHPICVSECAVLRTHTHFSQYVNAKEDEGRRRAKIGDDTHSGKSILGHQSHSTFIYFLYAYGLPPCIPG